MHPWSAGRRSPEVVDLGVVVDLVAAVGLEGDDKTLFFLFFPLCVSPPTLKGFSLYFFVLTFHPYPQGVFSVLFS